ncbi:hypothetical protein ScPMuIL_016984 [Solemya velum]
MTYWYDCPDGEAHWTNWAPGEPSIYHSGRREECAYMIRKGPNAAKWNDVPASKTLKFVCEIPLTWEDHCSEWPGTIIASQPVLDACLLQDYTGSCSWNYNYYLAPPLNQMTCAAPCDGHFRLYM